MNSFLPVILAAGCTFTAAVCSAAQSAEGAYPARPMRMVIPFAAGGGVDIIGRIVASKLSEGLGQQIIVDNRVGAGSTVGTDIVAKAPADGYTLLVTNNSLAYNPSLYPKLPYETLRDLAPVTLLGTTSNVVIVHPTVPAKNLRDLLELMKAKPGQLNYGSGGVGGSVHLAFELFQNMAGIRATHVPYKGVGPAMIDVVGGRVQVMIAGLPPALGHIKANRLRALAVTSAKRAPSLPEVPTVNESGVPGYEYVTWYPMLVPAAVPKSVIAKLNESAAKALSGADLREKFSQQGVDAESSTPDHLTRLVREEIARWGKIIKAAGIQPE
jgi:tripartite-type tricarboxylate transporter receptor subunit TctC